VPKKQIALFGCGIWGQKILRELLNLGAEVHVFDIDEGRGPAARDAGAVTFQSVPKKHEGLAGIIVATPATTHRAMLEVLTSWDLPIFVEKPLVACRADFLSLKAAAPNRVFLMHTWRYHTGIQLLSKIAAESELGAVLGLISYRTNWTSPRVDTDSIWNLLPHDLTIAKSIFGFIPRPQSAVAEMHRGIARGMHGLLGDRPWMTFEISNRFLEKKREVRLHCERGVAILKSETAAEIEIVHGDDSSPPDRIRLEKRAFHGDSALVAELKDFLNYLDGGAAPLCDLNEGLEVVANILELRRLAGIE
jgi:predicted dehydrogenase